MTKESACWLTIRLIGLLLLGYCLLLLLDVFSQSIALVKLHSIRDLDPARVDKLTVRTWVDTGIAFSQAIATAALCFYFLRHGKAAHRLLMRE
ncbi:hypothetical protein [Lysobacter tyrosinilyticus]